MLLVTLESRRGYSPPCLTGLHWIDCVPPLSSLLHLERRKPELVTAVLRPEDTEQEAVHAEQNTAPQEYSKLLSPRVCNPRNLERKGDRRKCQNPVNGGDDLRFETELVAESTSKVVDAALAVTLNVGCLTDVVEHVARGKEEDSNQREGSPEVAVLEERQNVGSGDGNSGDTSKYGGGDRDDL